MKRLIIMLSVISATLSAFAVTHANKWVTYDCFIDDLSPEENRGLFYTDTIGPDTIIDGKTYFPLAGYLFRYNEDSTRIYCRVTEQDLQNDERYDYMKDVTRLAIIDNEILYYAYDVHENDTLTILKTQIDRWATICVIDSVKTIEGRRYVYNRYAILFEPAELDNTSDWKWEKDCWIEGIGSLQGFHQEPPLRCASMYAHYISYIFCASHDDELLYRESEEKAKSIYNEYGIISPCHEDVIVSLDNIPSENQSSVIGTYNVLGQEVDESYHGIVIQDGKKRLQ